MIRRALCPAAGMLTVVLPALLAACSYQGDIDNPATIKATWFSYLNGDDIRAACSEGGGRRYRLVYNADYNEQLRSYEIVGDGDGDGGATLIARVQGASGLRVSRLRLADPLGWVRWTKSVAALSLDQAAGLDAALEASGAFAPAPSGLQLFSKETYWISSLCRDGKFFFNAWRFPSDRYRAVTFDDVLFSLDDTGVAVRAPVAVPPGASAKANVPRIRQAEDETGSFFNVKVGENGLTSRPAF